MVITQTWHKLQPDAEKYGRELREDCSVKRVASTREPALVGTAGKSMPVDRMQTGTLSFSGVKKQLKDFRC